MKAKQIITLFLLIVLSINVQAQFKIDSTVWNKAKLSKIIKDTAILNSHEDGQMVYNTKFFIISKPEMFTSQFKMIFGKVNDEFSFSIVYQAYDISDIEPENIKSLLCVFTDGTELEFPKTQNSTKVPLDIWTFYGFNTTISQAQIELFSKKRLLAVQFNVEGDKRHHNGTIPNNRSIELAQMVHYFLTKQKLYEEDILKVFSENQKIEKYVNNAWNF